MRKNLALIWASILIIIIFMSGCYKTPASKQSLTNTTAQQANLPTEDVKAGVQDTGLLKVHFLSVGKADCTWIQAPTGENMMIDAGDDLDANYIYSYLKYYGVETIDVFVLTHPHNDHIGAADMVLRNFKVKKVIVASLDNLEHYLDAYVAMEEKMVEIEGVDVTKTYSLGAVSYHYLWPIGELKEEINDQSLVMQMTYGTKSFLFTGDIYKDVEAQLIEVYGNALKSDVLKVPHHGSESSSSDAFIKIVAPEYSMITVGSNNDDEDHPSDKTLKRFDAAGTIVYKTNETGTLIATTDGDSLSIEADMAIIPDIKPKIPDRNKVIEFIVGGNKKEKELK